MAVNPSWSPNAPVAAGNVILDANNNVQQWLGAAGTTGATPPTWSTTLGGFSADGTGGWMLAVVNPLTAPPLTGVISLPAPLFVNDADGLDPNAILNDMVNSFQNLAGRTLQPAQVERLLIDLYAYRESLVRSQIQNAALQNMVAFLQFPMLDYLGQLVGVSRLPSTGASATIQVTLAAALSVPFILPAGTLFGTQDGQFAFATSVALTIAAGATTGVVSATCTTPGSTANGYAVGQISIQLNPSTLISAVSNTTISSGGSAPETDAHLRTRIQAAPNLFSVAGPTGAYRYWALSADPSIIDAVVSSPQPGSVNVYVLPGPVPVQPASSPNTNGIASAALLAKVAAIVNSASIRPLTDTVAALAVTEVDYTIVGTVTLYSDADLTSVTANINAAAAAFALALASRIQRDVVPSEIIGAIQAVAGVYQVVLTTPTYTALTAGQWANCTAITLTVAVGTEHS
jgi:phage-related baseplate assembly protein